MRLSASVGMVGSGELRLSHPIDCNVYAIDTAQGPLLIDTGAGLDTERIRQTTAEMFGSSPVAVVLTHCHADHSQGGPQLQNDSVSIWAPEPSERFLTAGTDEELGLDRAIRDGVYPEDYEFTHYQPDRTVADGETVSIGDVELSAVSVRGHAVDHLCYLAEIDGCTVGFVGDVVYPDGSISLLNTSTSSLAEYREDIEKLAGRDIDMLLPGHGPPRLREGQDSITQAIDVLQGLATPPSKT